MVVTMVRCCVSCHNVCHLNYSSQKGSAEAEPPSTSARQQTTIIELAFNVSMQVDAVHDFDKAELRP